MSSWWTDVQENTNFTNRDEAQLIINNRTPNDTYFYGVYKDCYKCPYTKEGISVANNGTTTRLVINTLHPKLWRFLLTDKIQFSSRDSQDYVLCDLDPDLKQFGIYNLEINTNYCKIETLKEPVNIYTPIFSIILIYFLVYLLIYSFIKVTYVWFVKVDNSKKKGSDRVQSIDAFRGVSIVLMIFVNYGCGGYATLDHVIWNGLHVADLVFPWFMWIMGFCIPIAIKSAKNKGISKKEMMKNITRRSCILFLIGFVISSPIYLKNVRIPGILQRFGACYFVVATSCVFLINEEEYNKKTNFAIEKVFKDIITIKKVWLIGIFCTFVHLIITFFVSAPGCPKGYLGPGGLHQDAKYTKCTGGATGYIDSLFFGDHIYQKPEIIKIYKSDPFDPEGILGFFTSILQVIIGVQAGVTLQLFKDHRDRLIRWFLWGLSLSLIGGAFCGFSKEEGLIPVNKNLWSISFVLITCGTSYILLFILYYLIDLKRIWNGKPFTFCGMNSILLYVGHNITYNLFPIHWLPSYGLNSHFITLMENVWGVSLWILVAYICYKTKWFLTV